MRESNAVPQEEKPVRGELLTISEAAKKIRMSRRWIYENMEKGTLPFPWFMPSPGKRLLDSADLDDWLRLIKIPAGKLPGEI
jgi:excisionase family DNA binding protein